MLSAELQGRKAEDPQPQRLRGVQAAGQRLREPSTHGYAGRGTVTQAGCGALCPSFDRGLLRLLRPPVHPATPFRSRAGCAPHGMSEPEVMRVFRTFNAASEAFLRESERHEPRTSTEEAGR